MGKGIDLARETAPIHAALLDDLKDQLLIAFVRRFGDIIYASDSSYIRRIVLPVEVVDDTGGYVLAFSVDAIKREFTFELQEKH